MSKKLIYLISFILLLSLVGSAGGGEPQQGKVLIEYWNDIPGNVLEVLYDHPLFPDQPDDWEWLTEGFDKPYVPEYGNEYGARLRAYLHPPGTGDYSFWVAGDDYCDLWLSTDDEPSNKVLIAWIDGWCPDYDWDNIFGTNNPNQDSAPIYLEAGRKYYIEAEYKENDGGDGLAVAWQGPGIPTREVIQPEYLSALGQGSWQFIPYDASPADGAIHPDTWVTLVWSPGLGAALHNVYFGENFDDVEAGTGDAFRGNQTETYFVAGFPGYPYPDGLVSGTTYYWRIEEVNDLHPDSPWKANVWSFTIPPKTSYGPDPPDGAQFVDPNVELSWGPGFGARLHTVYFGEDFDVVSYAAEGISQGTTTYAPGPLTKEKVYYWRVDEFDGVATYKGDVWRFKTVPDISISDPYLMAWWKLDEISGNTAVDSSGHDNHGTLMGDPQWVAGQVGGALELDGDGDYVNCGNPSDLNITNYITVTCWIKVAAFDKTWETILAKGDNSYRMSRGPADGDSIYFGCDGPSGDNLNAFTDVTDNRWHHVALVYDGHNKIIYIDGAEDARMESTGAINVSSYPLYIGENSQATNRHLTGLVDDVRVYNKSLTLEEIKEVMRGEPDLAWDPNPSNGSTPNLRNAMPLTWSPGDKASQHDVYFGTDEDAVENAGTSDTSGIYRGRQSATSYNPPEGVEWGGGPYYWRIDENNTDSTISKGRVWDFTVADFIAIDDFESYNDLEPPDPESNRIFLTWMDGYEQPANGSQVGYTDPPFCEQSIVHSGLQAMPCFYDNSGPANYSEATLPLTYPRDWTEQDVKVLTVWFRGNPAAFIEAPAGTYTMSASGVDIYGAADEFRYAYKQLLGDGEIIAQVLSVQNTDGWAKAGVMIRETLNAGSKHAFCCITPSNGKSFQNRKETNQRSWNSNTGGFAAPYWVRLVRQGNEFTAYHSADGVNWELQAANNETANPETIPMATNVYIGLALTSHNPNETCVAEFSDVQTTGTVSPAIWTNQAIGVAMVSNDPEPMYVAVSNATGPTAVVYHDNPDAAGINAWTEWSINLEEFSNQGIVLTNVDSLSIGFGNKNNPQVGGSGLVYFDDIRLYRLAAEP